MRTGRIILLTLRHASVISAFVLFCVITFAGCGAGREVTLSDFDPSPEEVSKEMPSSEEISSEESSSEGSTPKGISGEPQELCVFVCGAVSEEGVYILPEGSRVIDAVEAAGGFTKEADTSYINQAAFVQDAEKIDIPTADEAAALREKGVQEEVSGPDQSGASGSDGLPVDLNTADAETLMRIPGIGEVKAARIVQYREEHGRFGDIEEITNVNGIGESSLEQMRPYITVR